MPNTPAAPVLTRNVGAWPHWLAWFDGHEELGSGTGRTEEEAIADLMESL